MAKCYRNLSILLITKGTINMNCAVSQPYWLYTPTLDKSFALITKIIINKKIFYIKTIHYTDKVLWNFVNFNHYHEICIFSPFIKNLYFYYSNFTSENKQYYISIISIDKNAQFCNNIQIINDFMSHSILFSLLIKKSRYNKKNIKMLVKLCKEMDINYTKEQLYKKIDNFINYINSIKFIDELM